MNKLLECPFCGVNNAMIRLTRPCRVKCMECSAEGPETGHPKEADEAWNARPLRGKLEALEREGK